MTTIDSLPVELLDKIFCAVSNHSTTNYIQSDLYHFSLVSRTWRAPAQRLLFADVLIHREWQGGAWLACETRACFVTKRLWISRFVPTALQVAVVRSCPELDLLSVHDEAGTGGYEACTLQPGVFD